MADDLDATRQVIGEPVVEHQVLRERGALGLDANRYMARVDFVDDPLKQILGNRLGAALKRCRDRWHHTVCLQGVDGVFELMGIG